MDEERQYNNFEGDLSKGLIFKGAGDLGIQDTSGLAVDAMNTWYHLPVAFELYSGKNLEKL